jgi:hypothetical protein
MKITLTEEQLRELISNHLPEMARAQHDTLFHRWYLDTANNTIHAYEYCSNNSWQQNDDYIQLFAAGNVYCDCDWCQDKDSDVGEDYETLCAIEDQIIDELKSEDIDFAINEKNIHGIPTSTWQTALAHCSEKSWQITGKTCIPSSEDGKNSFYGVEVRINNDPLTSCWMTLDSICDPKWIYFNKKSFKIN